MNEPVIPFSCGTVSTESQGAWEYMSAVVIGVFSDQIDTSGRKIEGYAVGISEQFFEFFK